MSDVSQARYSTGAIIFHWLIAVAVIANWRIAEAANQADMPAKAELWGNHKALGIAILVLSVLRLLWRFTHRPPPFRDELANWERIAAHSMHIIFYALLIGLPLFGWYANSLNGREIDFFGLFTIGALPVGVDEAAAEAIYEGHELAGKGLLILVAIHVLGALKHSLLDKVPSLSRMWFGR